MERQEALERTLQAFGRYYTVKRDAVPPPFSAVAEFRMHNEQYFLIRAAKITEYDCAEYVYFKTLEVLDAAQLKQLCREAWEDGLARAEITENHKSTDVVLVILATQVQEEAAQLAKKMWHSKSYYFGLRGFSHFRLIAYDLSAESAVHNRMGGNLKEVLGNIFHSEERR
jgi:hypothetical protein